MPLTDLLRQRGDMDQPVLIYEQSIWTRRQLCRDAEDLAGRLTGAGIGRGTRVLLSLSNSPAFLVSLLALSHCRAVAMPVNPRLAPEEGRRIKEIGHPEFAIGEEAATEVYSGAYLSEGAVTAFDPDDDCDIGLITFTSGTTGVPKGVMMSEAALLANARAVAEYLGLSDADRTLVFLPLCYTYMLSQVLSTLTAGGCIILLPDLRYPSAALAAMVEHRVSGFGGVPTSLMILSRQQRGTGARPELRRILSAGGPLAPALVREVQRAFPGAALFNNYGCTEIGPRATFINYSEHPEKTGSIGQPIPGVGVVVVRPDLSLAAAGEIGEIVLSGPTLMKGYYRDPEATASRMSKHGFHTGDYAYVDDAGFLFFQGREDDVFKSAGEKVSAKEVEDAVLEHEDVAEVAVVSRPDALLGAVPVAYVVLRPGAACSDRDLQGFCARRLSRYKVPRTVHFVEELRRTETGKVQKYRLREVCQ